MVLLLFQDPFQGNILHWIIMSSQFPLVYDSCSVVFPVFHDFTWRVLRKTGQVFCIMFLNLDFCYFPTISTMLWVFRKNTAEVKFSPYHIISRGYMILTWLIIGDVNLHHLIKVVFIRCLYHKAQFPPFPYSTPWMWVTKSSTQAREIDIKLYFLEGKVLILFVIILKEGWSLLFYLFIHSIIYLRVYHYSLTYSYFTLCNKLW